MPLRCVETTLQTEASAKVDKHTHKPVSQEVTIYWLRTWSCQCLLYKRDMQSLWFGPNNPKFFCHGPLQKFKSKFMSPTPQCLTVTTKGEATSKKRIQVEFSWNKGQHDSISKLLFSLHKSYSFSLVSLHIFPWSSWGNKVHDDETEKRNRNRNRASGWPH